jgi:hypothetical protein
LDRVLGHRDDLARVHFVDALVLPRLALQFLGQYGDGMTGLVTFWTTLDALLDHSELDIHDVHGQRIFPCYNAQGELLTKSCIVLRDGKNIAFRIDHNAARAKGYDEAKRVMDEIEAAAK